MFVMMCEVRKNGVLVSAHPIDITANVRRAKAWMHSEPELIVEHLNKVTDDKWYLGDCNDEQIQIFNEDNSIERLYVAKNVEE